MEPIHPRLGVTHDQVRAFCERWQITRFELFGSVLREDFGPESDVDVLVTFAEGGGTRIDDLFDMEDELRTMFGRGVDLVKRRLVETDANTIRREHILGSVAPVYEAA